MPTSRLSSAVVGVISAIALSLVFGCSEGPTTDLLPRSDVPQKNTIPNSPWDPFRSENPLDHTRTVGLVDGSSFLIENGDRVPLSGGSAVLFVRCTGRKLDIYVELRAGHGRPQYWPARDASHTTFETSAIRLKFDERSPVQQRWEIGDDHKTLFAASPKSVAAQIMAGKRLMIEFEDGDTGTMRVVALDIHGLRDAAGTADIGSCKWDPHV